MIIFLMLKKKLEKSNSVHSVKKLTQKSIRGFPFEQSGFPSYLSAPGFALFFPLSLFESLMSICASDVMQIIKQKLKKCKRKTNFCNSPRVLQQSSVQQSDI